jgi:hypothetical protein
MCSQKSRYSRYNSKKRRLKPIFLKLYRIDPLPLFAKKLTTLIGVAEKHDFCNIQQKIPQISNFAKKPDSNPPTPWGYCGGHCKNVCKIFFAKIRFRVKKHDFCNNPI